MVGGGLRDQPVLVRVRIVIGHVLQLVSRSAILNGAYQDKIIDIVRRHSGTPPVPANPTLHMMDRVSSAVGSGGGGGGRVERMDICLDGPGGEKRWTWVEVHTSMPKGIERCFSHQIPTMLPPAFTPFIHAASFPTVPRIDTFLCVSTDPYIFASAMLWMCDLCCCDHCLGAVCGRS